MQLGKVHLWHPFLINSQWPLGRDLLAKLYATRKVSTQDTKLILPDGTYFVCSKQRSEEPKPETVIRLESPSDLLCADIYLELITDPDYEVIGKYFYQWAPLFFSSRLRWYRPPTHLMSRCSTIIQVTYSIRSGLMTTWRGKNGKFLLQKLS